jgi:ATP-dependent protease ClpP protease subunit
MAKKRIDLAGLPQRAMNLAPRALGPGHLRLAAKGEDEAELMIYGDIGGFWDGVSAEETVREIASLDVKTLHVRINSPGGSVFDGVAIYNSLVALEGKTKVITYNDGLAASISSVIFMAGDERHIAEGASVMVHAPWTMMAGNAKALRAEADLLDELEGGLLDIYEARTKKDRKDIAAWVDGETWFRGQKAVDAGFADVLVAAKGRDKKALHTRSAMLPLFLNTPQDLMPQASAEDTHQARELERLLRDVAGFSHTEAKRATALAKVFFPGPRDDARNQSEVEGAGAVGPSNTQETPPPKAEPAHTVDAATELAKLKDHILALVSK